jgi:hypothetical protein
VRYEARSGSRALKSVVVPALGRGLAGDGLELGVGVGWPDDAEGDCEADAEADAGADAEADAVGLGVADAA